MMRKIFTSFLSFVLLAVSIFIVNSESEVVLASEENPFSDTSLTSIEGRAAAYLQEQGVINGYADGTFKGDRVVNRAEVAKFLLLAKGYSASGQKNNGRFSDLKEGKWYVEFIVRAAELGILNGYGDGSFRPSDTVNTAEFIKMAVTTFGLSQNLDYSYGDVSDDHWFAPFVGAAQTYNFFPRRNPKLLQPTRDMTRNEIAVAMYKLLTSETVQTAGENTYDNTSRSLNVILASDTPSANTIQSDRNNFVFMKFDLKAGAGEDLHITEIEFRVDSDSGSLDMAIDDWQLIDLVSGKAFGMVRRNADRLVAELNNFTMPAGVTKKLALRGDITTHDIDDSFVFQLTDVTTKDPDGEAVPVKGMPISSSAFVVEEAYQVALPFPVYTPAADIIVAGKKSVPVALFNYTAEKEDVRIDEIRIVTQDPDNDHNIAKVQVSIDGLATQKSYLADGKADFSGFDYIVDKGDTAAIQVSLDLNPTASGAVSGDTIQVGISSSGFSAVGQSSLGSYGLGAYIDTKTSKEMTVYRTKPTVTLSPSTPYGWRGQNMNDTILMFDVAADSQDDVTLNQITVRLSSDASLNLASAGSTAYLKSHGSTVATGTISLQNTSSGLITFPSSGVEIAEGTSRSFAVQVDTTNLIAAQSGVSDLLTPSIFLGDATTDGDFWWSDGNVNNIKWLGYLDNSTLAGNVLSY